MVCIDWSTYRAPIGTCARISTYSEFCRDWAHKLCYAGRRNPHEEEILDDILNSEEEVLKL